MKLINNQRSPKWGEEGYTNPAFKFDMLCDVLISNLNAITKDAVKQINAETRRHEGTAAMEKLVVIWQVR
jgi:hypothetical protein